MTLKTYVIQAIAAAAAVGAGSTLITNKVDNAKQDVRIERLEGLNSNVEGLRTDLDRVDRHLSLVEGKLQQQDLDNGRR